MPRCCQLLFLLVPAASCGAEAAKDLNPVKIKPAPSHAPLTLVEKGRPRASIAVMNPRANNAAGQLQEFIQEATGAKLPIVQGKITAPAIVLGDCALAKENGIEGKEQPVEGFTIKTIPDHVLIVGRDEDLGPQARSDGTAWGVTEFLERFVGVRWYFPGDLGKSIPKIDILTVPPA